ncbi:hypothetical protein [Methanonatronarchaeum sp. AMET-Sl]|uniref:hypothetical protein n=1 Tax=Methanonatronarchaeum sp. AMET-Sl TaxID=3037654 RepID=UPI00244E031E|nr:hypothetical protein [Methanonatronarchaeum sp. AMET-Sl]WGI17515.1 hypothetical protein QEN48_00475 [Methanonatronarchaeum sp. AMET-Sl]
MDLASDEVDRLREVVDSYMELAIGLDRHCNRCLETRRWGGSVVLMVLDAAFTSVGLNYFNIVVPQVMEFENRFVERGRIVNLSDLSSLEHDVVSDLWKNERSWHVARKVAELIDKVGDRHGLDDRLALRRWASESSLVGWRENPVGEVKGVGVVTYQYLRMMGGVDTSMPDGVVRRVVKDILVRADVDLPVDGDIELVETIDYMSDVTGYRSVEITWMTWLVQSEGDKIRMEKYRDVLERI